MAHKSMLKIGFKEMKAQERVIIPNYMADFFKNFFKRSFPLSGIGNPLLKINSLKKIVLWGKL